MKHIFYFSALLATLLTHKSFAQDSQQKNQLTQVLFHYYHIKDALVASNSSEASTSAEELVKSLNSIDYKVITEGNINALLKDATAISETKDIQKQRERFANLSDNLSALTKTVRFSSQPFYKVYCPMKKAYWLSPEKEIKNPYYGSSMPGCGQVVQTIQ